MLLLLLETYIMYFVISKALCKSNNQSIKTPDKTENLKIPQIRTFTVCFFCLCLLTFYCTVSGKDIN